MTFGDNPLDTPHPNPIVQEFVPADFQTDLPLDRVILKRETPEPSEPESSEKDALSLDVIFVGAGPAGLAGAIQLKKLAMQSKDKKLAEIEIAVFEKADQLGGHCLSGAIINPQSLFELFPEIDPNDFPLGPPIDSDRLYLLTEEEKVRIPLPNVMKNEGNFVGSICHLVKWLGVKAEEMGIHIFTGVPVQSLLMKGERVIGIRTTPAGLNRDGFPGPSYLPPSDVISKITVLSEGVRGSLTQAYKTARNLSSLNPQIYALGVKELWETKNVPLSVIHTLGWPIPKNCFGGGWIYPMSPNQISFGLVVGLDYPSANLDIHFLLQDFKRHPLLKPYLEEGQILEWGAKLIPEGGFYSLLERLHGDGLLIVGDAAGLVNVASLKGIHYAIRSGMIAAKTIYSALEQEDSSAHILSTYDDQIKESEIMRDLYRTRNMRLAFKSGFYRGGFKAELMALTRGRFPGKRIQVLEDGKESRLFIPGESTSDTKPSFTKEDAVFYSGNTTRDDIPQHLIVGKEIPAEIADFYTHLCPAGVYERRGDRLIVNSPNCIDCKATDVLGPRWMPREKGSGPRYRQM